jgi:hypothetical protein
MLGTVAAAVAAPVAALAAPSPQKLLLAAIGEVTEVGPAMFEIALTLEGGSTVTLRMMLLRYRPFIERWRTIKLYRPVVACNQAFEAAPKRVAPLVRRRRLRAR